MAGLTPIQWPREIGRTTERHRSPEFVLQDITYVPFRTRHPHGRKKLAIRQHIVLLKHSRNADITFDFVVVRSDVFVGNRPILAESIVRGSLEIEITQPIALTAPDVCSSSHNAQPAEIAVGHLLGTCVRLIVIVGKPFIIPFGAGVALSLNRTRLTNDRRDGLAEFQVSIRQLVDGYMLGEISIGLRTSAVQH